MLQSLRIENFILIEALDLKFHEGICVLTGETGAGKSIIIDAVSAILGGKAGPDTIRAGATRARLEATFKLDPVAAPIASWLEAEGIEPALAGELHISRDITAKGSRCRIEGVPIPQAALRELAESLVDILGQHEHTLLTHAREHLTLLDRFGGPELEALRVEVGATHGKLHGIAREIKDLEAAAVERGRQRDFWQYQLAEIEEAALRSETEEEELKAERQILANAEDLRTDLVGIHQALTAGEDAPSLVDGMGDVIGRLRSAASVDAALRGTADSLEDALSALQEASREVRRRFERLEADPERLREVEQRLDTLRDLLRKYGPTMTDLWAYRDRIQQDLELADNAGERIARLHLDRGALEASLGNLAKALTEARSAAAARMEAGMAKELADLGMKEARFSAAFRTLPAIGPEGAETVEYLLAPNPGEPLRPLAKTASGGELARLMLALKTVLVRGAATPTLIFDEVDTGISGRAAQVVAQKIASLGHRYQILLITHMPAIAAVADSHWHLEKRTEAGRTRLHVEPLDAEGRVGELAHLASGDASSGAATDHARELLSKAHAFKRQEVAL